MRAGRPRVLLFVSAVVLVGTLGLAWYQTRGARALGDEQPVGDTILRIRPPVGWVADPEDRRAFILPVSDTDRRRRGYRYERRIGFRVYREPAFLSVDVLMQKLGLNEPRTLRTLRPARIGDYPAWEVHRFVPRRLQRRVLMCETVVRFTCLPRGHVITVVYDPLIDLRPADAEIMADVCASVRVVDDSLAGSAEGYLEHVGVSFEVEPSWVVVGPDLGQVAGLYVGGALDGAPSWSIGVFRTWLADHRKPADLLVDFAAESWLWWDAADQVESVVADGNVTICQIRHPQFGQSAGPIQSAWIVERGQGRAVLLFVYAGAARAAEADEVARRLCENMDVAELDYWPDLAAAADAGRKLAEKLTVRGALPRWGRGRQRARYIGETTRGVVSTLVERQAVGLNAEGGYKGVTTISRENQREETMRWALGPRAASYTWQADMFFGKLQIGLLEERGSVVGPVNRRLIVGRRPREPRTFQPGSAFVPPPTEELIEGWVARGEAPAALVEHSTALGLASHSVLLQQLASDEDWPRVLLQVDYYPLGAIEAFDEARAEVVYVLHPAERHVRSDTASDGE